MAGREHDHELLHFERMAHEARRHRKLGECDLAIAAAHQIGRGVDVFRLGDLHGHARIRAAVAPDDGRERVDGERRERDDVERAGDDTLHRFDRGAERRDVAHDRARRVDERRAGCREAYLAPGPLEQLDAQLPFERANRLRQRRLGHVHGSCAPGESALVHDGEHVPDLAEIHRSSLSSQ